MPIPRLKITYAQVLTPVVSKTDLELLANKEQLRAPTWQELQPLPLGTVAAELQLQKDSSAKTKVAFFVEDETEGNENHM